MDFHSLQVLRKILTTTPQSPASGGLGAWLNCFLQEVEFVIIFSVFLLRAVPDNCKWWALSFRSRLLMGHKSLLKLNDPTNGLKQQSNLEPGPSWKWCHGSAAILIGLDYWTRLLKQLKIKWKFSATVSLILIISFTLTFRRAILRIGSSLGRCWYTCNIRHFREETGRSQLSQWLLG